MSGPIGQLTRGTTGYNRLRRSDRWLVHSPRLRAALLSATDAMSFESPSQVSLGQPPLFAATDVLVTEKGLIGENDSTNGNVLSVFRPR